MISLLSIAFHFSSHLSLKLQQSTHCSSELSHWSYLLRIIYVALWWVPLLRCILVPSLVNLSACSYPSTLLCPGSQQSLTLSAIYDSTILNIIVLNATLAWLSQCIVILLYFSFISACSMLQSLSILCDSLTFHISAESSVKVLISYPLIMGWLFHFSLFVIFIFIFFTNKPCSPWAGTTLWIWLLAPFFHFQ